MLLYEIKISGNSETIATDSDTITSDTYTCWEPWLYPYCYPQSGCNYKCPQCGGEFNYPSFKNGRNYCPFCGEEMKGL